MTFFGGRGGNNPRFGRDAGPPPLTNRHSMGSLPYFHPHQQFLASSGFFGYPASTFQQPFIAGSPQHLFAPSYPPGAARPTIWPSGGTSPANPPTINPSLPAANMTNSTGGVGCEPGYNYFFPAEHTKIHVFETGDTPPWLLPPNFVFSFNAVHVPVNTTLGDLLKGFGACNTNPSLNRLFEVHQGGDGKWYKGMCIKGDDFSDMDKTIKSKGWDSTRTGMQGGKPVVYLYVTKG